MSRGPGRIERAISDLFEEHPEGAWTTAELCRLIYPTANRVEKKHRVAVLRAMNKIIGKKGDEHRGWGWFYIERRGTSRVLANFENVMSYGLARLKASNGPWHPKTEEELLEQLRPGGDKYDLVVPGGAWDRHVRKNIAERDGDQETVEKLAAQQNRELAMLGMSLRR